MATVTIQRRERKNRYSYLVSFKVPLTGKKKHYGTFQRSREAKLAAHELRAMLDAGKMPKSMKLRLNPINFEEVAASLIQEWKERKHKKELSDKTFEGYRIWLNVLTRIFGNKMLCTFTTDEIRKFRDNLAREHSNITSNKYLSKEQVHNS